MSEESERVKYLLKYWSHLQLAREYEQLENIIKEVREKVNKALDVNSAYVDYEYGTELLRQELLEILDKVGEDNE